MSLKLMDTTRRFSTTSHPACFGGTLVFTEKMIFDTFYPSWYKKKLRVQPAATKIETICFEDFLKDWVKAYDAKEVLE